MRSALAAGMLLICSATAALACQCTGCGCKGGPGFRGPNRKCVSYKELDRVCGSPPTSKCTFEHYKPVCEHEGAPPDKQTLEHYQHSIEGLTPTH